MIPRAKVCRNPCCAKALQSVEEPQVIGIRRMRVVKDIAGNDHEVNLVAQRRVYHAIVCFGNGIEKPGGPLFGKRPQPAKGRPQMKVGCVDECQRRNHEVSVARKPRSVNALRIAGHARVVNEIHEARVVSVERQRNIPRRPVAMLRHD